MKTAIGFGVICTILLMVFMFVTILRLDQHDSCLINHQAQIDSLKCEYQIERVEILEYQLDSLLRQYRIDIAAAKQGKGK